MKRILTFLTILFIAWVGYETYEAGRSDVTPPAPQPVVMNKGKAHGERLSTRSWSIEYDKVIGNADQTVLNLEGVRNGVFYKNDKPYLHFHADHVTVNTVSHDFNAIGPLHIETVDRIHFRSLDTTAANWNQASKHLTLPNNTIIRTAKNGKPLIAGRINIDTETGDMHIEQLQGHV